MTAMNEAMFQRRLADIPERVRGTVESVARELHTVGAYQGSETDSVTDAIAILEGMFGFDYAKWPEK